MTNPDSKVVVCALDFSDCSEAALIQAVDYAERLHGKLHLIHSDPTFHSEFGHVEQAEVVTKGLEEQTRAYAIEALGGENVFDVVGPEIVVRRGVYAGDAILQYADEVNADYIILGTHGRRGVRRFIVGSVAEYVVRGANCPVLTVPMVAARSHPGPSAPILVPIDYSEHSRMALREAKEISKGFSAPVELVHVLEDFGIVPHFYLAGGIVPVNDLPTLRTYADSHLRELDAEVGGEGAAGYRVRSGSAHREIPKYAEEIGAGLIVMATHGLSGVQHALMGSVTERTLRYAKCPLLSVAVRDA